LKSAKFKNALENMFRKEKIRPRRPDFSDKKFLRNFTAKTENLTGKSRAVVLKKIVTA
jgi:hypothetical protein